MNDGLVIIDKPEGCSSAQVVAGVKRLLRAEKAGHAGTLDPFARGVLVCCINRATRLARFLLHGDKAYEGVLRLGVETDTEDPTGAVLSERDWSGITAAAVHDAFRRYEGDYLQTPPVYSALKQDGVPLYALARKGRPVRKAARPVRIRRLRVLRVEMPEVGFEVGCSGGTYIRTLCADIGRDLGCGGHLSRLTRTESCGFTLGSAVTLERLAAMAGHGAAEEAIIPMAAALPDLPEVAVGAELIAKVRTGRTLTLSEVWDAPPAPAAGAHVKILDPAGALAAVVQVRSDRPELDYCCVFQRPGG
jgi:tRNA pseudouridine55 synthase